MENANFRVVFLGTSYTAIKYTTENNHWTTLVANEIGFNNWKRLGTYKAKTEKVYDEFKNNAIPYKPHIIVLETGLHDMVESSKVDEKISNIRSYYQKILDECIKNNIKLVISTYGRLNYNIIAPLPRTSGNDETGTEILINSSHDTYYNKLHNDQVNFAYDNNLLCCNLFVSNELNANMYPGNYNTQDGFTLNNNGQSIYASYITNILLKEIVLINKELRQKQKQVNIEREIIKKSNSLSYSKQAVNIADAIISNLNKSESYEYETHTLDEIDNKNNNKSSLLNKSAPSLYTSNNSLLKILNLTTPSSNNDNQNTNSTPSLLSTNLLRSGNSNLLRNQFNFTEAAKIKNANKTRYVYRDQAAEAQFRQSIVNSSSDQELIGEGQIEDPELVVSFETCKKYKEDQGSHHCKYMDIGNRCIFDHCIFDTDELPKVTRKWYTQCIICTQVFARDPRYMKVPFCDSCIKRMQAAEKLPFTCINCGKSQNTPSKIMFSSICDYCVDHKLFNNCCLRFKMGPSGVHGVNTNHEPVY